MTSIDEKVLALSVQAIIEADSLIITAGAGMGVDSGLPDFRGDTGFWKAYPALSAQDLHFYEIASPIAFKDNPRLAWGFYGHRLNLYRKTIPHKGFQILKAIGETMKNDYFIYTSNVDGQFQKAEFDQNKIVEVHGSIQHLQCMKSCKNVIHSASNFKPVTNDVDCLLSSELPTCDNCGSLLRPNILMFDDWGWNPKRYHGQRDLYHYWLNKNNNPVIIELGAGTAIPTIRNHGEYSSEGILIRINPRDNKVNPKTKDISIASGALEGLELIRESLVRSGYLDSSY